MIKKSGALLFAILYSVTVFGFALNLHYCGRLLVSVKINGVAKNCAGLTKMKCCKDKQILVKVKDAHQGESPSFAPVKFSLVAIGSACSSPYHFAVKQLALNRLLNKAPPDIVPATLPRFVKNCTFLI